MKPTYALLLVLSVLSASMVGCGEKDVSGPPEAWTKLDDHAKLEKIKNMPLSPQQKVEAIQKLNVPDADKQAAVAEVNAAGSPPPTNPSQRKG